MELRHFELFVSMTGKSLKSIQRFKARKMKKYGLSSAHTNCLYHLLLAGEDGLTQMELVRHEMTDPSQISRVLRELIVKGYARLDGEEGKYRRRYMLTDEGLRIAQEISGIIDEICTYVCRDIPEEEVETFYRTFQVICDELQSAEEIYLDNMTD